MIWSLIRLRPQVEYSINTYFNQAVKQCSFIAIVNGISLLCAIFTRGIIMSMNYQPYAIAMNEAGMCLSDVFIPQ